MGAICLTESDERVRPRAALKSASDERPKPPNTSLHFRMQCRKSALHNAVQDGKDAAVHWNSGVQAHVCADVGVSPQGESGTGRQGQSRQEPVLGRSFFPLVAMLGGSVWNRESKQRADFVTISHWLLIWSGR